MAELQDGVPRILSPLDAPTILGRLRALDVYKIVPERHHHEIKSILMRHCQSGVTEMWWEPFGDWALQMRYSHDKDSVPFRPLPTRFGTVGELAQVVIPIEDFARSRGFQLTGITDPQGAVVGANVPIEGDVDLAVGWSYRGASGRVPLAVRSGLLDPVELSGELNALLRRCSVPLRLLLLPPRGEHWGLIWVDATVAGRAALWGRLDQAGLEEPVSSGGGGERVRDVEAAGQSWAPRLQVRAWHFVVLLLGVTVAILYWGSTLLDSGTEFDRVELPPEVEDEAPAPEDTAAQ